MVGLSDGLRRRASSNYFELDADRRRTKTQTNERLIHRLTSLEHPLKGPIESQECAFDDDETSIDFCCERLQLKFGFQEGSIANQREHVLLLLANTKARGALSDPMHAHTISFHHKLMANYKQWCSFLHINPLFYTGKVEGSLKHTYHMDIVLYFLIWGEAANIRHMPECICYLFHQMIQEINKDVMGMEKVSEGWFLTHVIRPIWHETSNMQRKNALKKPLEHVKIRNYDDINEYFWKSHCLSIPIDRIGTILSTSHQKTFYEHRSLFTLVLNYYRIFQFNLIFLLVLIVLSFAVTISPGGGETGWKQFSFIGQTVFPYSLRDLKLSFIAIFFSLAILSVFKCILEMAHGWHLLWNQEEKQTSSRSFTYGMALCCRFLWNGAFVALFGVMIEIPLREQRDTALLGSYLPAIGAFILPGGLILVVQAFSPQLITNSFAAKFIREGSSCYVGRNMSPPFSYQVKYIIFWSILWIIKAIVSFFILVRPLMLPSLAIYNMDLSHSYQTSIISFHNIGLLFSLWLPVVFIFNYDTQIYFTIFQALLGALMGCYIKTGEIRGFKELSKAFRIAPQLFDQKIVTIMARMKDEEERGGGGTQMMLRFVVVWNEIVTSFREGDLIDDKEAAILQYDIHPNGQVFEPVFLSAGKVVETIDIVIRMAKDGKGESQLRVALVENDCLSCLSSFYTAGMYVMESLLGNEDENVIEGLRRIKEIGNNGGFMKSFNVLELGRLRIVLMDLLEAILDLEDPSIPCSHLPNVLIHSSSVIHDIVNKMEVLMTTLQAFCVDPVVQHQFTCCAFLSSTNGYLGAARGLVNLYYSDTAMGAATRTLLLLSLDRTEAMPQCPEAQRRLGFFMKSLVMEIPQLRSIKEMRSFSVVTPFYAETVLFSLKELNDPLINHPIFQKVEENGKNLTILKYLSKIHPEEWNHFLERMDVSTAEEAQAQYPQEIRLWASARGQTLARTVQGMMMYEDAIKLLYWLEIGSNPQSTAEEKQAQLQDMVCLKFSYICACQVYGKHRQENQPQADDIDYLLCRYPNLRVAYVDTIETRDSKNLMYDTVLIKSEGSEITEVYRYQLPGDPILGEGKPENQNNGLVYTRGEFVQTIDMNQQHYFEECLKMPCLLATATLHPSGKPVSIIGMREHIFTGNASSLAKFKTWQELVFVTLSQRVLANPLYCRMHYGHPDVFDKILNITRGGLSKASKGINLSEDVFAGFNATLRGGVVTHVEFMQCGKGRDVALSQISMFEGKLANGAGETCLAREAHRMGQFMDFCRLNSMYYSHTGFYFATWMTIVTTFVYMYSKVYITLAGVQRSMIMNMDKVDIIKANTLLKFDKRVFNDADAVINTQYYIQAGLFLSLPLIAVYFGEMGLRRGFLRFIEMIITGGPAFFIFQVGTTMHYFDNNLLHGEAQYKATGRGFKITREAFVLLYKAYAASHYRKAFELIGLCFIYLSFGDFKICDKEPIDNRSTYFLFCQSSQGFGVQTFAIWFISILWIISPFLFNTDGLDWEKTKADVKAWALWMYAEETYIDEEDAVLSYGWIRWWKDGLEIYYNTRPIARWTVLLRESRHFLLMWYVITLKWNMRTVAIVFGSAVVSILILGMLGSMRLYRHLRPGIRALLYLLSILILVVSFFITCSFILEKDKIQSSLSLFFGYMGGLYGINEMARMWSFKTSSITSFNCFLQLAFFFDFIFSISMILPLILMSIIPFLNVIQTRMMYNKGFSEVVSASSQYAFSLAAFMGIIGGAMCGWIFFLFSNLETSPDFIGYVTTFNLLNGKAGNGFITYSFYTTCIGGTIINGVLNYFIGRRLSIVMGGLITSIGMMCLITVQQYGEEYLIPGIICMGFSISILIPTITIYIYEVATPEMKSKALLLVGFGFVIGTFAGTWFTMNENAIGWLWQIFVITIILSIVTPAVYIFPESPYWVYHHEGLEALERCLSILRRKESVETEVLLIRNEGLKQEQDNKWFKYMISSISILLSAFLYGPLNMYMSIVFRSFPTGQYMFINCIALQFIGALFSFFFIDKVDHRRILFATLIPMALLIGLLGYNALKHPWNEDTEYLMLQIVGLTLYFFIGMGMTAILWLTSLSLFITKTRYWSMTSHFILFFMMPIWALYIRVNKMNPCIYLFSTVGIIILYLLVLICVDTRHNGIICTKKEAKEEEKERQRQRTRSGGAGRTPRSRNVSRSARITRSQSNYTAFESPGAGPNVPGHLA